MDIIPVIDLKGGLVVHAKRGERDNYRPLATPLANSAVPRAVVDGILSYRGFTQLYIADLDAIAGGAPHGEIIHAIATRHADVRVWLDAGLRAPAQLANLPMLPNIDYVLGSESMSRLEDFHALCAVCRRHDACCHSTMGHKVSAWAAHACSMTNYCGPRASST